MGMHSSPVSFSLPIRCLQGLSGATKAGQHNNTASSPHNNNLVLDLPMAGTSHAPLHTHWGTPRQLCVRLEMQPAACMCGVRALHARPALHPEATVTTFHPKAQENAQDEATGAIASMHEWC